MSDRETSFIAALRALATDPAARRLNDDAAVLRIGGTGIVMTHDMIVEGVHFLPDDPPGDVAWKLVAVNLSDLAAKGAEPIGVLLGYMLGDDDWNRGFVAGLGEALTAFEVVLLGGDTVSAPERTPRALGMTTIGEAPEEVPARSGARPGDALFVTGTIGDAGAGLAIAREGAGDATLLAAYRRPMPRIAEGIALAGRVNAMMDVSDGLLIDAARMAEASGLAVAIDLDAVPLSEACRAARGDDRAARIAAATAGDDYQLLFAAPGDATLPVPATRIGAFAPGSGLSIGDKAGPIPLPARLGYLHD